MKHDEPLSTKLSQGLAQLAIKASGSQQKQLLALLQQLLKWNKSYNLTAISDPLEGISLHLLDSLAVLPFIKQKTLLDVGTGAGFPGLPLAIMLPKVRFTLLDSNSKKTRFIRQQVHWLALENVEVVHSRVEIFHQQQFEGIISRAFTSIANMLDLTQHLLTKNGRWLAMKAVYDADEIKDLSIKSTKVNQLSHHPLIIPGLSAPRCLIEIG